ncbi:MAG: glycerol-3-phosphate 1-O-acyltransferase PlsY [Dolichospermum sp. JUN01]|jgi:glycerol-3-phosphate acyltransferase PlsY|uniref:glycerol-3-phosphate 1-O-acyltransferase PlsY n=1 Tax=Dolichospermum TaxID=748770 RepID=UPI0011E73F9B|nr:MULTISPECIES: glycerol-3-phosphate 1-O-acyltransferase PlsY [Dolichospermum]MBO1057444.1 glycerol-3-phosphate 1-O-acyltransferase PlsY [Dolichospermum sp. JUN01]MBS9394726.1 glycerol-3-phosphate 1-O-acyltransferase PlsY [Dolichospermum sp. OL01]MCO5798354.1 glycerol-3-phosphate 1-O-acyltransferase PlsY [Dolichospermum sp. OL03]MCS6280816.1 glycerol-3-phosphate 1-O-acyltransferase PlsY [Dolichospermum sp.]QSV59797.1 MAG: glycerol-3-phosphate 1-O-acyltransferase PlsY [Dolichospermum sp. LBC05
MFLWLSLCGVVILLAYLFGSFPTGYLAGKLLKGIDIREVGSGSTGATNVLRTLGKIPGAFVLLIDALKGGLAINLGYALFSIATTQNLIPPIVNIEIWQPYLVTLAGLAALLGHSKSIFLGFTGGKSVASGVGILLAISWQVGLSTLGVFAVVIAISRIVSLSSIAGAVAVSILMVIFHQPLAYILLGFAGGLYVIIRHRTNIERLIAGTEPKIGQKAETPTEQTTY